MKKLSKSISGALGYLVPLIIILATITPFVMFDGLFFPYITGKAFYFRILVEIAAALYIVWALVDKSVRPRMSPLAIAVIGFLGVLTLATITATDPSKSFWSNYERMEGLILFIHLVAYFFIAGSVMKYKEGWWKWFFTASLVMSVIVGISAFVDFYSVKDQAGYRIFGNLGNSSYLGVYSLIHIFIALFLIVKTIGNRTMSSLSKEGVMIPISFYTLVGIFNLIVLFNTGTRGSFVGLVFGLFVAAVLTVLFEKSNKFIRKISIVLIALSVVFVLALGFGRNSSVVKNSDMLSRFAELVTLDVKGVLETQGKARSLLWGMAWEGVKDKPVLGWGLDNFHYVFSVHYDPGMYGQEQWFDRSHNVFMDWLTQAGFLGLISYLSLFGSAIFVIWRKRKDDTGHLFSGVERAVLTGGLVAYLGHNLFVFDNLSSYMLFFSVLAFLHQYSIKEKVLAIDHDKTKFAELNPSTVWVTTGLALVTVSLIVFYVNIKPIIANTAMISSIKPSVLDPKTRKQVPATPKSKFEHLQRSISYQTMTNSEQIEQLADRGGEVILSPTDSPEYKDAVNKYVVDQYEARIAKTPNDSRVYFFYSIYLQRVGNIKKATEIATKLVSTSPNKQSFLNYYGLLLLQQGDVANGLIQLEKSYLSDKANVESLYVYLGALIQNKRTAEAENFEGIDPLKFATNDFIVQAYIVSKQSAQGIDFIKKLITANPNSIELRSALASIYVRSGSPLLAISTLQDIKKIAPQFSESIDQAIVQIKAQAKIK